MIIVTCLNCTSIISKLYFTSWLRVLKAKLFCQTILRVWESWNSSFPAGFPFCDFFQGCFSDATMFPSYSRLDPKKWPKKWRKWGPAHPLLPRRLHHFCHRGKIHRDELRHKMFKIKKKQYLSYLPSCCHELNLPDICMICKYYLALYSARETLRNIVYPQPPSFLSKVCAPPDVI